MDQASGAAAFLGQHMVFNGSNYLAWRTRIRKEIELAWNCPKTLQEIPATETPQEAQQREEQERKAAGMLFNRIGNDVIMLVANCSTVRQIFAVLEANYGNSNISNALTIQMELDSLQLDPRSDVQKFFTKVDGLINQLRDCGVSEDDKAVANRYLKLLPVSMKSIRQSCRALMPLNEYTSAHVKATIIQECYDMKREQSSYRSLDQRKPANRAPFYPNSRPSHNGKDNGSKNGHRNGNNGSKKECENSSSCSSETKSIANGDPKPTKKGYRGKNFDINKVKCYRCHETGHYANDCKSANLAHVVDDSDDLFANMIEYEDKIPVQKSASMGPVMEFMGDSGANRHIICEQEEKLINTRKVTGSAAEIRLARKGLSMVAAKIGDLPISSEIDGEEVRGILTDVLYVPDAGRNFLSTLRYMQNGYSTASSNGKYAVYNPKGKKIMSGNIIGDKIMFKFKVREGRNNSEVHAMSALGSVWHGRFGHMCSKFVEKLSETVVGVPKVKVSENMTNCEVCAEAKFKKLKHNSIRNRATRILELIHLDIMGRISPASQDDHEYILVIVDDWSHFTHICNLRTKDEAPEFIKKHIIKVNNSFEQNVINVRCDNALEFINNDLKNFFDQMGITLDLVPPRTPQLNAIVERMNGTLANRIRALLFHAKCPVEWWHFAAEAAVYLVNRSPTSALEFRTPYERWYGRKPDVTKLRIFGSVARVITPENNRKKLDKRAWSGILVGQTDMASRVYNVRTRKVEISPEVRVDESRTIKDLVPSLKEKSFKKLTIEPKYIDTNIGRIAIRNNEANMLEGELTYKEAISGSESRSWMEAINHEFQMMKERNVWKIIPRPKGKIMDTKWVLKRKSEPGGIRYRARLCARGFKDKNIYVVSETYSPTVKLPTVRLLLVLALENDWKVTHLDVSSAFLYGDMKKDVVISIPEGMNVDREKFALKLNKALYGLKVSSNAWYCKVKEILLFEDYHSMITEPSVYVRTKSTRCVILVFVDDILVTGSDPRECERMICYLEKKVQIRNLGTPKKFLGITVTYENNKILLKQEEYIVNSSERFQIGNMRSKTPMEKDLKIERPKEFDTDLPLQEILGTLMYACIGTRPDATYAANYLSRFQSTPTNELIKYSKRVLAYLCRTKDRGIWYRKSEKDQNVLVVFCDASFASDVVDRKSTTGLVLKFGENTFHWRTIKQKCITKSSTEAEYMALSAADTEARSYSNFLNELGVDHRVVLKTDNSAAIDIAYRRDSRNCRHIDVAHRVVEESLAVGRVDKLIHIPGEINDADLLTKSVSYDRHELLCNNIMNE